MKYEEFLTNKTSYGIPEGIKQTYENPMLFDFQREILSRSLRRGRSAVFSDCGTGKTPMELTWAENIVRHTNKPVLILTPLAVSAQMIREGNKFGVECKRSDDGKVNSKIVITNYERLEHFNRNDFAGVVLDESSILKSFNGSRKTEITEFMRKMPYRLLATATAAPNDYIELGTSSECLGNMGYMDMLAKYFKNDQNNCSTKRHYGETTKWRFKGHSELPFWRWVTSWATACRKPSDLGFEDGKFILPKLSEEYHLVHTDKRPDGMLFNLPAATLPEQRDERKRTIEERCDMVNELVENTHKPALVWCHLNEEGDTLEEIIPDSVQISGHEKNEVKEQKFMDFVNGKTRVLITKPKIGAWGLNFQHCAHVVYFPSHSYEQYYQAVRRCWRFGQKSPVKVDIVLTEGERRVMENMKRKAALAAKMFENLVNEMNRPEVYAKQNVYTKSMEVPSWL